MQICQVLQSAAPAAVTKSLRLCACLCSVARMCDICIHLMKRSCKVCLLLKHFPNEPLLWHWQQCEGWRHGNRLLAAYSGPTPRQGGGVGDVCHQLLYLCMCWWRLVGGRSSPPLCCSPPRSLCSGEELQSCDIRPSPGTHSFSKPLTLHSSSAWDSLVNYHALHQSSFSSLWYERRSVVYSLWSYLAVDC